MHWSPSWQPLSTVVGAGEEVTRKQSRHVGDEHRLNQVSDKAYKRLRVHKCKGSLHIIKKRAQQTLTIKVRFENLSIAKT